MPRMAEYAPLEPEPEPAAMRISRHATQPQTPQRRPAAPAGVAELPFGSPRSGQQSTREQELMKPITEQLWPGAETKKWLNGLKQPLHGEFVFEGSTQRHKYVAMPRGYCARRKELAALAKHWGLSVPNLIIKMNYSCHDAGELVYEEMLQNLPDYQTLADDAGLSDQADADDKQADLHTVNAHLETRLTGLWRQLASACAVTNSWIMLKHLEGRGGNDAMLAKVMRSQASKPVFLDVMDLSIPERTAMQWRTITVKSEDAADFAAQVVLLDGSEEMCEDRAPMYGGVTRDKKVASLKNDAHQWEKYACWAVWQTDDNNGQGYRTDLAEVKDFLQRGGDVKVTLTRGTFSNEGVICQAAENSIKIREHAKPWNVPLGEPLTIKRVPGNGHLFYPNAPKLATEGCVNDKQTVFFSYFNSEATHHVFAPDPRDFDETLLGPVGNIFSGGNSGVAYKDTMIDAMADGQACIFLDNTGGESQEIARLILAITGEAKDTSGDPITFDSARDGVFKIGDLLKHAKLGQLKIPDRANGGWMQHLTTEDALAVSDLYSDRKNLFGETIITVNPLKDSPDEILTRLSKCIASVQTSSTEVGAGPADQNAVFDAWHVHATLTASAARRRIWADRLAALAIIVTFMATATAILDSWITAQVEEGQPGWDDWEGSTGEQVIKYSVVILPAIGGLVAAVIAEGSYLDKWATNHMAAMHVRGEMYHFRMRVGRYAITGDQDGEEEGGGDVSMRMLRARQAFSARVQILTRETLGKQVSEPVGSLQSDGRMRMDWVELDEHVTNSHYGTVTGEEKSPAGKGSEQANAEGDQTKLPPGSSTSIWLHAVGSDDMQGRAVWERHVGSQTSHEYLFERVLPMLQSMERDAPGLQRMYMIVQVLSMIAASLATVLGATGQTSWIPIAVSASTVFTSVLEHYKFKIRLNSTTQAMGELRALVSDWEAMNEISKRMPDARSQLVHITESVELSHAGAWAGGGVWAEGKSD